MTLTMRQIFEALGNKNWGIVWDLAPMDFLALAVLVLGACYVVFVIGLLMLTAVATGK